MMPVADASLQAHQLNILLRCLFPPVEDGLLHALDHCDHGHPGDFFVTPSSCHFTAET
jgi:hypothetical protein